MKDRNTFKENMEYILDDIEGNPTNDKLPFYMIADALYEIAYQIKYLGFGNAYSEGKGALEGHTMKMTEAVESLSSSIECMGSAVAEAITNSASPTD